MFSRKKEKKSSPTKATQNEKHQNAKGDRNETTHDHEHDEDNEEEKKVLTKYSIQLASMKQKSKLLNQHQSYESKINNDNSNSIRLPLFSYSELKIGPVLGKGGFCTVNEIQGVTLIKTETDIKDEKLAPKDELAPKDAGQDDDDVDEYLHGLTSRNESNTNQILQELSVEDPSSLQSSSLSNFLHTRTYVSQNTYRDNDARYAIKVLTPNVHTNKVKWRGMFDLAIEAEYLSVLSHPGIVKMRGVAGSDPLGIHSDNNPEAKYFILMDRLFGTLLERMEGEWTKDLQAIEKLSGGGMFRRGDTDEVKSLKNRFMIEKLIVASDISSAFSYIHSKGLVYRDIKAENIGFDVRGDVKIFDFGLCKELPSSFSSDRHRTKLFKLTARTGSKPYMAPEVMLSKHYNQKADVYSFAILLYEIFELKLPFQGFSHLDYVTKVCNMKFRPKLKSKKKSGSTKVGGGNVHYPVLTKALIEECWDDSVKRRPDFDRIHSVLRAEMQDLALEEDGVGSNILKHGSIHDRSSRLLNRSRTSFHNRLSRLNNNNGPE